MMYRVEYSDDAIRDLDRLSPDVRQRAIEKTRAMHNDLAGNIKRLRHGTSEYRLRVGDYRVLFDVEGDLIIVQAVKHRSEAYG